MSRDTPNSTGALIAQLVDGLEPVRPLRFSSGMGFTLAGLGVTLATVALMFGRSPGRARRAVRSRVPAGDGVCS